MNASVALVAAAMGRKRKGVSDAQEFKRLRADAEAGALLPVAQVLMAARSMEGSMVIVLKPLAKETDATPALAACGTRFVIVGNGDSHERAVAFMAHRVQGNAAINLNSSDCPLSDARLKNARLYVLPSELSADALAAAKARNALTPKGWALRVPLLDIDRVTQRFRAAWQ